MISSFFLPLLKLLKINKSFFSKGKLILALLLSSYFFSSQAFSLEVVASTRPIHSIVSAIMKDVGSPYLIVQGAGSPHNYALRPNDARAIQNADIVFWTSPELETFLIKPLTTIADSKKIISVPLVETQGLVLLPLRDNENYEPHHHDGDDHHEHEHAHEHEHDNHNVTDNLETTTHNEHNEHYDTHFWLDPQNAALMADEIARQLAKADPQNADKYLANAKAYKQRLDDLMQNTRNKLASVQDKPLLVFHDAYQYFEKRFGVDVVGSVTINPEHQPTIQHIRTLRQKIQNLGAVCIFSEPQFQPKLINTIIEGTKVKTGTLDPLGYDIPEGEDQYITLIEHLGDAIVECVNQP